MVKSVVGILPWAIVVTAIGGAIWWMLARDIGAGRWVLAALLVGHGLVHVMFSVPTPAATAGGPDWPFDMARSWMVTSVGLDFNVVRSVGLAVIAIVVVGFAVAALSTVGFVVPSGWWRPVVAVSAVASAVLLVVFFEPQLSLGLGIDAVVLGVVAIGAWAP
jgi:hypothetical protein